MSSRARIVNVTPPNSFHSWPPSSMCHAENSMCTILAQPSTGRSSENSGADASAVFICLVWLRSVIIRLGRITCTAPTSSCFSLSTQDQPDDDTKTHETIEQDGSRRDIHHPREGASSIDTRFGSYMLRRPRRNTMDMIGLRCETSM